jgi:hypothetical protein
MLHPRLARLFSYLFGHEYCIFCVAALEECCFELPFVDWHLERCLAEEMRDRSPVRRRTLCVHGCIDAFCHGISHMAMDARQKEKRERERERESQKLAERRICGEAGAAKEDDAFVERELFSWLGLCMLVSFAPHAFLAA